jgi:hypothetical protein
MTNERKQKANIKVENQGFTTGNKKDIEREPGQTKSKRENTKSNMEFFMSSKHTAGMKTPRGSKDPERNRNRKGNVG